MQFTPLSTICRSAMQHMNKIYFEYFLFIFIILSGFIWQFSHYLSHDIAWYLIASERMLNGAKFAVDIIEVNPPLMNYLTMPAIILAKLTSATPMVCYKLLFILAISNSLFISNHLLKTCKDLSRLNRHIFIALIGIALTWGAGETFGQRDPLMFILILPYALLIHLMTINVRANLLLRILIGIMAGIGIALKPYFLAILIALEIYLMWSKKSIFTWLRIETILIATLLIAYISWVYFYIPEYFATILPYALKSYEIYRHSPFTMLLEHQKTLSLYVLLTLYILSRGRLHKKLPMEGALLALAVGCIISFMIQRLGFTYHLAPVFYLFFTLITYNVIILSQQKENRKLAAILLILLGINSYASNIITPYKNPLSLEIADELSHLKAVNSITAFSNNMRLHFHQNLPYITKYGSRYPTLWTLPYYILHKDSLNLSPKNKVELAAIKTDVIDTIIKDFKLYKPDVVIIDDPSRRPSIFGNTLAEFKKNTGNFSYLSFFKQDQSFAKIWKNYQHVPIKNKKTLLYRLGTQIWTRKDLLKSGVH